MCPDFQTSALVNKLVRSSLNVRKTGADSIDDLAASIAVHGLLQNLTVTKKSATGKTKSKADTYEFSRLTGRATLKIFS